jgi:hypothetical protein
MAYLNNNTTVVDAVLTNKGRELLAQGNFNVVKFALADDEIDYTLYDSAHPLGTAFYGTAIENMPVTEAVPDETLLLRYKLVTLPATTKNIPKLVLVNNSISVIAGEKDFIDLGISTSPRLDGSRFGYTAILSDTRLGRLEVSPNATQFGRSQLIEDPGSSRIVQSLSATGIRFYPSTSVNVDRIGTIRVTGNESGATTTINVTVTRQTI